MCRRCWPGGSSPERRFWVPEGTQMPPTTEILGRGGHHGPCPSEILARGGHGDARRDRAVGARRALRGLPE